MLWEFLPMLTLILIFLAVWDVSINVRHIRQEMDRKAGIRR